MSDKTKTKPVRIKSKKTHYFFGDFVTAGDGFLVSLPTEADGDGFLVSVATDAAGDGDAAVPGATDGEGDGEGTGTVSDCKAELTPFIPGSDNVSAINMKATAAPIVIFANMFCVPRGPNAVLETLLVKSAPASALPGCSKTTTISTKQERINNPYRV